MMANRLFTLFIKNTRERCSVFLKPALALFNSSFACFVVRPALELEAPVATAEPHGPIRDSLHRNVKSTSNTSVNRSHFLRPACQSLQRSAKLPTSRSSKLLMIPSCNATRIPVKSKAVPS
eukprot:3957191-Amphidinium_carterae.1